MRSSVTDVFLSQAAPSVYFLTVGYGLFSFILAAPLSRVELS